MRINVDSYKLFLEQEYPFTTVENIELELRHISLAYRIIKFYNEGTKAYYRNIKLGASEINDLAVYPIYHEVRYLAEKYKQIDGMLFRNKENIITSEVVGSESHSLALNASNVSDPEYVFTHFFRKPCPEAMMALMELSEECDVLDFRV
jgi:hypothetical protein